MALGDHLLWHEDGVFVSLEPGGGRLLYAFDGRRPRLLQATEENDATAASLERKMRATARLAFALPREGRYRAPGGADD